MSISMYQASVPVFIHHLNILSVLLAKGEAHAAEKKIDSSVFTSGRLAPDMLPLIRQIQIATDGVKGGAARLAGVDVPSYPDTETSFEELQNRIKKTVAFLETFSAEQIDGSEEKEISLTVGGNELKFTGQPYLLNFVIPNLFFHVTVTYAILRHLGVNLGKKDYLGAIQ